MKFMRLLVMFDLPTKTNTDKDNCRHFRKYLLTQGYFMLQYSVYYRILQGLDPVNENVKRLKNNVPTNGSVYCIVVTERQFQHIKILVGKLPDNDKKVNTKQLSFF